MQITQGVNKLLFEILVIKETCSPIWKVHCGLHFDFSCIELRKKDTLFSYNINESFANKTQVDKIQLNCQ